MILGTYTSNISSSRRIAIPKKFRNELGEKYIIARWYESCLVLVSESSWRTLINKLTGRAEIITAPVRDTDRFILGSAYEVEPDTQGRIILPKYLADYAKLKTEAVFLGLGDRAEIWSPENWEKQETYLSTHAAELVEKLAHD